MNERHTADQLRELFSYDAVTGSLKWKVSRGTAKAGSEAGCITTAVGRSVYRCVGLEGAQYLASRLIWCLVYGNWPVNLIDHKDGDGLNNRLDNLREASYLENARNRRANTNSRSGLKGVSWKNREKKWSAEIRYLGTCLYLGLFDSPEDAHREYCRAADLYHGQFANHGKVDSSQETGE